MTRSTRIALLVVLVAAVVAGGAWLWWRPGEPPTVEPPALASAPAPASTPEAAPPASALPPASSAAIAEPLPPAAPLAAEGIGDALVDLVSKQTVLSLLQTDDFPRRLVATVDNLGRSHAPAMLWPVQPAGGRFTVIERDSQTLVSPDNAARYAPLVLLAEKIDIRRAVDLYVRMLPVLQKAYEDIGFPNKRFHARLLEVLDQLLATPEVAEPVVVRLTEVKGPIPSERPWVRYELADASLQSATAGQKILMRVGKENRRRLEARLAELRRELASRGGAR